MSHSTPFLLLVCALLSGCLRAQNTLLVQPDGSARLTQQLELDPSAEQAILGSQSQSMSDSARKPLDSLLVAQQVAEMAPGARLDQWSIDKKSPEGPLRIHIDAFIPDVRTLDLGKLMGQAGAADAPPPRIGFKPGSPSLFYIIQPKVQAKAKAPVQDPMEQMAQLMALQMLKGLNLQLELRFTGQVSRTNAGRRQGNQIQLLNLDMDQMQEGLKAHPSEAMPMDLEGARKLSGRLAGLYLENADSLWVEIR